jgi:UDP-glucose 4,6-dehydratase
MTEHQANGADGPGGYVPRNILVTGGAGFIASHVVTRLVQRYANYKVSTTVRAEQEPPAWRRPPARRPVDAQTRRASRIEPLRWFLSPLLQVVVLDKLDYCATLNNLAAVAEHPNFKVGDASSISLPALALQSTSGRIPLRAHLCAAGEAAHEAPQAGNHRRRVR